MPDIGILLIIGMARWTMRLACVSASMSSLRYSIALVIEVGAQEQMTAPDAGWVIAVVEHVHACRYVSPRHAMGLLYSTGNLECSIARRISRARPQPAAT